MAIYETAIDQTQSTIAGQILGLIFAGPQKITGIRSPTRNNFAIGINQQIDTLQASISVSLWCLGLIFCVRDKSALLTRSLRRRRTRGDDIVFSVSKAILNFCRKAFRKTQPKDDLTYTEHRGSCQCGAVQFTVRQMWLLL